MMDLSMLNLSTPSPDVYVPHMADTARRRSVVVWSIPGLEDQSSDEMT
jgi:hypothetical protein